MRSNRENLFGVWGVPGWDDKALVAEVVSNEITFYRHPVMPPARCVDCRSQHALDDDLRCEACRHKHARRAT